MTTLKEKDIVKEIVDNWGDYFPDLQFCKTEYSLRNFRVDMLASFDANLKDLGLRDEDYFCKPAVFIEVKYNSNMRDLIFELQKQIQFRDWYINTAKAFCVICVLSDDYDIDMVKFMEDNSIVMYKYSIEDDDISTLSIEEYNSKTFELEEIGDKYYESV
jgi:hypothetical protein